MKLLPGPGTEPTSTSRRGGGLRPGPLLAGATLALSVSGCVSAADNPTGFMLELLGFMAVCFIAAIALSRLMMRRVYKSLGLAGVIGVAPIENGLPGEATIETITDTGMTMSSSSLGSDSPRYEFGLMVTPASGGEPYRVDVKAFVPRLYIPLVLPGKRVDVTIDPLDRMHVSIDFSRIGGSAAAGAAGTGGPGGMDLQFDQNGQPADGQVSAIVGAVRGGSLKTIKGSADQLLATGTHGTAVITSAQPLGKTVRDVNPKAEPSRLDDPVWVFTVEATVAGEKPFPAVFGHRVPLAKVASVAPGVKLAVAVDLSDRHNEVAIDWDKSPIGG